MRRIRRWQEVSPDKGPVRRRMFPFDDIIMYWLCIMLRWRHMCDNSTDFTDKYVFSPMIIWMNKSETLNQRIISLLVVETTAIFSVLKVNEYCGNNFHGLRLPCASAGVFMCLVETIYVRLQLNGCYACNFKINKQQFAPHSMDCTHTHAYILYIYIYISWLHLQFYILVIYKSKIYEMHYACE